MVITNQSEIIQVCLVLYLWDSSSVRQTTCMDIINTLTTLDPPVSSRPKSCRFTILIRPEKKNLY